MNQLKGTSAAILEKGRERYNAQFAAARKGGAQIDADAFLAHVGTTIAPIVDAVASEMPERSTAVFDALYRTSIELFAASLLGPQARSSAVSDVWHTLLPSVWRQLMRDPRRVAGALSNAAHNLSSTRGASHAVWMNHLIRVAPACASVEDLLLCGKVAAWLAGMAHYRESAIAAAHSLPLPILSLLLELPAGITQGNLADTLARLLAEPWTAPRRLGDDSARALREVACVGAFRGFGGDFLRPPSVSVSAGRLFVADGESVWRVFADSHGCVFIRHPSLPPSDPASRDVTVTFDGAIAWHNDRAKVPGTASVTSSACDGATLALTLSNSHHVFLFARAHAPELSGASA